MSKKKKYVELKKILRKLENRRSSYDKNCGGYGNAWILGLAALSFRQEALLWSEALKGPYTEILQVLGAPRSLLRARGTLRRPQGGKHLLLRVFMPYKMS